MCPCVYMYVCVRVCVCVYASLVDQSKTVCDKSTISSPSCRPQKKPSNDVFGDIVAHDRDLRFEGKKFESRPFR